MNIEFLGDVTETDSPLRAAGRHACQRLGLPISDAAFDLIDKVVDYVVEVVEESDDDAGEEEIVDGVRMVGDWPSGSGVISCYTAAQVEQWAGLYAWQTDLEETAGLTYDGCETTVDRIGLDLSFIATEIADDVARAVVELIEATDPDA